MAKRTKWASVTSLPLASTGSETAATESVTKRWDLSLRIAPKAAFRRHQNWTTELAANQPRVLRLHALKGQLVSFERKGHLVPGLQVQGPAKSLGDDQLTLGRNGRGAHGLMLTCLTERFKAPIRCRKRSMLTDLLGLHALRRGTLQCLQQVLRARQQGTGERVDRWTQGVRIRTAVHDDSSF
jgi:hypothetical protein